MVLSIISLVDASFDASAQELLMPDTVVQGLAQANESSSTTTDMLNSSSRSSPRPRLRKIAQKPADNHTLPVGVQAGVRKPVGRTKRTPFNTVSRAETSLTRTMNSCVRCRIFRNRVSDVS